jgi:wyosine [tRNA(Phe)-imidazoG37] synthetase (radical SAM superfamily)
LISFGPIQSRRLGKSLGINNIVSPKSCTYNCTYCQVGRTKKQDITRRSFFSPDRIEKEVRDHLRQLSERDKPDYLTIVSNGEPTLDENLKETINRLKGTGLPVAVITNGSLLNQDSVIEELLEADWVSVKMDAADKKIWQALNRPHRSLDFDAILTGVFSFFKSFQGIACTESMLVNGINDSKEHLFRLSELIHTASPSKAYISIPIRPPAEKNIRPPDEETLNEAWQIISKTGISAELLTGFEGSWAGYTGNAYEDILNITAVHPLREETLARLLLNDGAGMNVIDSLISQRLIKETIYDGKKYYMRKYNV